MIAYKVYGNERYINLLLEANQQYRDYVVFPGDVVLECPEITAETRLSALPPWRH